MSVLTAPTMLTPMPVTPSPSSTPQIYRFSVAQYHEMARLGILTENDRVELLEGMLVEQEMINPQHRRSVRKLSKVLARVVPAGWYDDVQQPITLEDSVPEADGMLIRGDPDQFPDRHPGAKDVGFVAEVSDSSLGEDRGWKKRVYARARIPSYWIVNLIDRQVEVYTDPTGPAPQPDYRTRQDYGPTDAVPLVIDGREIARILVSDLLP